MSTAFTNAFNEFTNDFSIVINALNGIHEQLIGSHGNYAPSSQRTRRWRASSLAS